MNYAYIIRRFKTQQDKALNVGQLVFLRKTHPPDVGRHMYTFMNLPQMNYYLRKWQYLQFKEGSTGGDSGVGLLTANEIDEQFTPHGVVQGEIGGDERDQPQERLLNLTIGGRARTFNIFGNHAPGGTPLWVCLVKVPAFGPDMNTFVYGLEGQQETVLAPEGFRDTNRGLFMFIPYAHAGVTKDGRSMIMPTEENLKEYLQHHYNVPQAALARMTEPILHNAYYVGRMHHHTIGSNKLTKTQLHSVLNNVPRMVTLPLVEYFADFAPPSYGRHGATKAEA